MLKFLTTLNKRLHFKLFFARFLITLSDTEFHSTSVAHDSRSGSKSSKAYVDRFRPETLLAIQDGTGCILSPFGPLCIRNNAQTE